MRAVYTGKTLPNRQNAIHNDGIDAFSNLQLHLLRLVVDRPITHADQPTLLHHFHQPRTDDQRFCGCYHSEQVPPRGESDGLLKATGTDVADGTSTCVGEKEDGDRGLFERQQEADVRVEAGKNDGAVLVEVVYFGENGVDERVEFHSVRVHLLDFGFEQHGIFYDL